MMRTKQKEWMEKEMNKKRRWVVFNRRNKTGENRFQMEVKLDRRRARSLGQTRIYQLNLVPQKDRTYQSGQAHLKNQMGQPGLWQRGQASQSLSWNKLK